MSRKKERPSIIVRKTKRGLVPVTAFDEEMLSAAPLDTEFELTSLKKRSWNQLRLYWAILTRVVEATELAPTAQHLHSLLKTDLGYVTIVVLFDGLKKIGKNTG